MHRAWICLLFVACRQPTATTSDAGSVSTSSCSATISSYDALVASGGACSTDADCACFNGGVSQKTPCGGVTDKATFMKADIFESDYSKATVITMFLLPTLNLKLRPTLLDLKPGTRIVSNSFTMEDWEADETATIAEDCTSWCTALFWIIPAKVEGTWHVGQDALTLKQVFQRITGTLGGKPISEGKLRGDEITFNVGAAKYTGRVNGNAMKGTVSGGGAWSATRP